jgi:Tfp pilus assembly protein PilF
MAVGQSLTRLSLTVENAEGEPLRGVKISVTCEALPGFATEETTNKAGRALFTFREGAHTYDFAFSLDGYDSVTTQIHPVLGRTDQRNYVLETVGASARRSNAGRSAASGTTGNDSGRVVFTAAERSFNEGVLAFRDGNPELARQKFLESIEADADFASPYAALASIELHTGAYDSAISYATRLLVIEPRDFSGFRVLFEANKALGNVDLADQALDALQRVGGGSDTAAILYNEGAGAYRVGDLERAKARFSEALDADPTLAPALSALAAILIDTENFAEAAVVAERLLAIEPDNTTALSIRYDAYRALGDEDRTRTALEALSASAPEQVVSQSFERAVELFDQGQIEEATAELQTVVGLTPEHPRAHYYLGLCYTNLDESEKAKEHLSRFVELAPDDPDVGTARAMIKYLQ